MVSGGWLIGAALGVLAGAALQLQESALAPAMAYAGAAAAGLALLVGCARRSAGGRRAALIAVVAAVAAMALGYGSTGWRAAQRLAERLNPALEGQDIELVGVVASLPTIKPEGVRFRFAVESARQGGRRLRVPHDVPALLSLGWYRGFQDDALLALPSDDVRAGQRWRFTVRLRQPHGQINPHGFDYELWLFEQGIRATGYVRMNASARADLLERDAGHAIERARQAVRDAIFARLGDTAAAGVLAALAVGDQASIDRDDWEVFRTTGIAHLVAISGLHVTMFAWLASGLLGALWRRNGWLTLRVPAVQAGRWGGLLAATGYAALAGFGVPAQRTLAMLAAATLLQSAGLRWPWPLVWGASALAVCLVDPWALLQPGFWLSFVAVGLLLASGGHWRVKDAVHATRWHAAWARVRTAAGAGVRTQLAATLGLAPLSLLFFHQLSLVGFVANLVAIPLVTLVVTPLALAGMAWPALWSLAAALMNGLMQWLVWLAALPMASLSVPAAPAWAVLAALGGAALLIAPLPMRLRALSMPLMVPLLWPAVPRPAGGEFELLAADVGQGTAVLVRTANHSLLYDTGPQYSRDSDAGERVLVPMLRALGVQRLDALVLSHRDSDHVGGAAALLRANGAHTLWSSLEDGHPLRAQAAERATDHRRCTAGQAWTWDGVQFELLHPTPAEYERAAAGQLKPNGLSCVLRVRSARHGALLAGDIEREQELRLAEQPPGQIRADVLLVPHHGSRTSSIAQLLDAVAPTVAVVQAGYRNRFGHPAPDVLARYAERGIAVQRTDACGAWRWASAAPHAAGCERRLQQRYWHREAPIGGAGPELAKFASLPGSAP
jgi:competence protein ComEC